MAQQHDAIDKKVRIAVQFPGDPYWYEATVNKSDNTRIPLVGPVAPGDNAPRVAGMEDRQLGIIAPLFIPLDSSDWMHFALIVRNWHARGIHFIAVVDVNAGSGIAYDPKLHNNIRLLKANGASVIGYVDARGTEGTVMNDMSQWKSRYIEIDGFFFNGLPWVGGAEDWFKTLDTYAKYDLGCSLTVGSVSGQPREDRYHDVFDGEAYLKNTGINIYVIYKDAGFPKPVAFLKQPWMSQYSRDRFGVIATNLPATDFIEAENFINEIVGQEHVTGYLYLHTDSGASTTTAPPPGPFNHMSHLTEFTARVLSAISTTELRELPDLIQRQENEKRRTLETMLPTISQATGMLERANVSAGAAAIPEPEDKDVHYFTDSDKVYDKAGIRKIYHDNLAVNRQQSVFIGNTDDYTRLVKENKIHVSKPVVYNGMANTGYFAAEDFVAYVFSESSTKKWLNTEQTAYFYFEGETEGAKHKGLDTKYAFQFLARGGVHNAKSPWEAACYKARMYVNGKVSIIKEIAEKLFGADLGEKDATGGVSVKGRWIGFKMACYNWKPEEEGGTHVVVETYIDDQCTDENGNLIIRNQSNLDTWRELDQAIDRGEWPLRQGTEKEGKKIFEKLMKSKQAKAYHVSLDNAGPKAVRNLYDPLSLPGGTQDGKGPNVVGIRAQGVKLRVKFYSCREILPPVEAGRGL